MEDIDFKALAPSGSASGFPQSSRCRWVELREYPQQPDLFKEQGILDDETLPGWLADSTSKLVPPASSRLRVLLLYFVLRDDDRSFLSCTEAMFHQISRHMGLPEPLEPELWSSTTLAYRYSKPCSSNDYLRVEGFIFKNRHWDVSLCHYTAMYDHRNDTTHALLFVSSNGEISSKVISSLLSSKRNHMHPLLICSIISQQLIESCHDELDASATRVTELTKLTGQHEYADVPFSNPLDLDFISTTRSLNYENKRVAEEAYTAKSLLRALEKIQALDREIKTTRHHPENSFSSPQVDHSVKGVSLTFNDAIEYQIESCQDLLNTAAYVEKRISTLIQVVYQFMTQKDVKTNIALVESSAAIATAAKADSSAMKTIAILGMFFLPGAFIAAIFAMPVIDWDENGQPIVKPAFKYYWAITAPLTLSVFLSWGLAMLLPWHRWIPKFSVTRNKQTNEDIELPSR